MLAFTGPFLLGITTATLTLACTNVGSWTVNPIIVITGPTSDWTLTNTTSGDVLSWDGYDIANGEVVTIDIPNMTCTNGAGTDLLTYLTGDIGAFSLDVGVNSLDFWSSGDVVDLTTTIQVCWYVELLGL